MKKFKEITKNSCLVLLLSSVTLASCSVSKGKFEDDKVAVSTILDSLNFFAAKADFQKYFSLYADNAVFTGTDATERWTKDQFMIWAKPYFDKRKAWNFNALERHIYFDKTGNMAWFDELLNTQMKICRGSGVLIREGKNWKIAQYILSTTIPNDKMDEVIKLKGNLEDDLMNKVK